MENELRTELAALMEASRFLDSHRAIVCSEPIPVFRMVIHARDYVDGLLDRELRAERA